MDHKGFFTTVLGIDDPEIVAVMNAAAHEEHYPRGHCLISMGEVRPSIHLLREGVLRAYVVDENGRDVTDCFIYQTGDVVVGCGELHKPSLVAIEAITPCRVLTLPMDLMLTLMDKPQLLHDEFLADDLTLALGVGNTGQQTQEMVGSVNIDQVGIQTILEHLDDTLGLVLTHETVVDMDADQLLTDGFDQQSGNDRRVNTAGKSQQNLLVANLLTDQLDLLIDKGICQLEIGDTSHRLGTDIRHIGSLHIKNQKNYNLLYIQGFLLARKKYIMQQKSHSKVIPRYPGLFVQFKGRCITKGIFVPGVGISEDLIPRAAKIPGAEWGFPRYSKTYGSSRATQIIASSPA